MSNQGEQKTGSQLLDIMNKNLEEEQVEEQEEDTSNKFGPNFQSINSENIKSKNKQENESNYEDFLNSGTEKLISGLNKLNLGNNSSNPTISPKKPESLNYFQNPMINMSMNSQNNQKDLAFNYYFGSGIQSDSMKKNVENSGQDASSQFLERLRFNPNNNEINEQQLKNFLNNIKNDENNKNEKEKIEKDMLKMNPNNMNLNQQGKMILNMNFQNKNNFGLNENMIKQNQNQNNINNLNLSNQMTQSNNNNINNMNLGPNMQFNQMDPRVRNMIQQNMMMNNIMMGNNNMQINQNQLLMNNQNNIQNQKNQNQNRNKKKKNKNKGNNNNNNPNIQNINLLMNQQQQRGNFQNFNQFIPNLNQKMQNNPMINYPSSQNKNQLNFNNRGFIPNNMNLNNMQKYNINFPQQNKFMPPQAQNEGGYMQNIPNIQNSLPMQIMNNNMNINTNFNHISLDQVISRANTTFPGKFFVIKSLDESNILSSIRFKIWCSTIKGNQKLQKAYKEADKRYPIFLFFSVNGSGKFMGIALMTSDVENKVNFNYWSQNDKWKGFFLIEWICIKDVPNRMFRSIINELNEGKPVTSSRDTQEIATAAGVKMLKVFKEYPQESTIFDSQSSEIKLMLQQNEHNMNNIANIGNNLVSINNINNNINNITNNINNISNNSNPMNMNNINNFGNLNNIGNFNQMMKMNPRNMEINYGNNNIMNMKVNNLNNNINNMNINNVNNNNNNNEIGNDMNNFAKIQMEMNNQEKLENNKKEDIKNNMSEQYDFNNILARKNEEDDGENEDK